MNKKHFLWRLFTAAFLMVLTLGPVACSDDDTDDGGLQLHYPEITDIGPSMNYISGAPSYYGAAPSEFYISQLKLDGAVITSDCFTMNAETGAFTISNTDDLTPGTYLLSVGCVAGGAWYNFPDIIRVNMLPAVPAEVTVSDETVAIPYEEVKSSKATVTVSPAGESVTIIGYALQQEEGKEYFAISEKGIISVNAAFKGDIVPGVYPLDVKVSTHAGEKIFEQLVTIKVTSPALELTYTPASGRMEYNMGFKSAAPVMKGSPEEVAYSIKSVEPATDKILIDPQTGVLTVEKDVELPVDSRYAVTVTVGNLYGATDFEDAFTLEVIGYIAPIDQALFTYAPVEAIQGTSFTAAKAEGFVGDEVTFSFGELPAALEGQISIDAQTGAVTAPDGNNIPLGSYNIPVKASNTKGEAESVVKLTIIENPYYFTYISYGNNLDLPAMENASQFWCKSESEYTALNLEPKTDVKPGVELEWSLKVLYREDDGKKYKGGIGTTIDPQTGVIAQQGFTYNGDKARGALFYVTATAGRGKVGETTVSVPVFFLFAPEDSPVHYSPFVFRVNPRKGGSSVAPTLAADIDRSKFGMDFRRDFQFWGFDGQVAGIPGDADSFMHGLWNTYYANIGETKTNYGQKWPLSYYENDKKGTLPVALGYIDPVSLSVVINPNKWMDADGVPARGAFAGEVTYVTDGNTGNISKGKGITPIWIWFDEKF